MARKTLHFKTKLFRPKIMELCRQKETFEVRSTSYTQTIKLPNYDIVFNEKGKFDVRSLKLINKVRRDGKTWCERGGTTRSGYIDFFKMLRIPIQDKVIHKIDIQAAYWTHARQIDLISKETNQYYLDLFEGVPAKEAKMARLKALGSLATKKYSINYIDGVPDYKNESVKVQPTKSVYMEVCRSIDETMKECAYNIDQCYYYYHDCMFVGEDFSDEVVQYFKDKDYNVTIQQTKLEYVSKGEVNYIRSVTDDIQYMVRKEDKYVLLN